MLFILILFISLKPLVIVSAESLLDLPFRAPNVNLIIEATVRDNSVDDELYFVKEYISPKSGFHGKISIKSRTESLDVHYSVESLYRRLIVQETQCDVYSYKSGWDKTLPGIDKPLLNLVLLLGPSILYRLNSRSEWTDLEDVNVRGTKMHAAYTVVRSRLKVTFFYRGDDRNEGLSEPSRITFEGYDPSMAYRREKELITMDIYKHYETVDIETVVSVFPGIGCPMYLTATERLPNLSTDRLQMIVKETVSEPKPSTSIDQYYIDDDGSFMRKISTMRGVETDAIYDYNLALIYINEGDECLSTPMKLLDPGIDANGHYSLQHLLMMDKPYKYLGRVNFEHRTGMKVKAWETVEYNQTVRNVLCDKVVTTLYMTESAFSDTFHNHVLVGTTVNGYKKGSANDYILVETVHRDFYDFKAAVSDDGWRDKFQMNDCYPDENSRINLAYRITCEDKNCIDLARKLVESFRSVFKRAILGQYDISPLRISNIDFKFDTEEITAYTTFLEKPNIYQIFSESRLRISEKFLNKLGPISTQDSEDCLNVQSHLSAPIKAVIYCGQSTPRKCYHLEENSDIIEDPKGAYCNIWHIPLNNLYRYSRELPLEMIHQRMIIGLDYAGIRLYGNLYKIDDVIDLTPSQNLKSRLLFSLTHLQSKLKANASDPNQIMVTGVRSFGDCFRSCFHSDENECETFSFCDDGNERRCLVTSTVYDKIEEERIEEDGQCNIYSKNHLADYHKVPLKKFKSPTSAAKTLSLEDCATFCYASECYSFQYCNDHCTYAGYYTDSSTTYSDECDIYIPKVSHRYQVTGNDIVTETFLTEINLNMEQCAALCFNYEATEESCNSFNYCPKGKSPGECQLSKYSVKDGKTKTIGKGCKNYELIDDGQVKDESNIAYNNEVSNGTGSGAAFGIVVLFLVGGLAIGMVAPFVMTKLRSMPRFAGLSLPRLPTAVKEPSFGWKKQVDDTEVDQSTI